MSLLDEFQDLAVELIDDTFLSCSDSVTIVRPFLADYDTSEGVMYEQTLNVTVNGIITPWDEDNKGAQNSDLIQTEDLKLLIAYKDLATLDAQTEDPDGKILPLRVNYDTIFINEIEYKIVTLKLTAARALYILRLAKVVEDNPD